MGLEKEPEMEVDDEDEDLFINDEEVTIKKPQMVVHDDEEDIPNTMYTQQNFAVSNNIVKQKDDSLDQAKKERNSNR